MQTLVDCEEESPWYFCLNHILFSPKWTGIYCHTLVTRHRVWICNWVYWTLITCNYRYLQFRESTQSTNHCPTAHIQFSISSPGKGSQQCWFLGSHTRVLTGWGLSYSSGWSGQLLLTFISTVIPWFSPLEIHDQDFWSLLDM